MKIQTIQWPEGFSLEGWDRWVFTRRLRGMIEGDFFNVCHIDDCRKTVLGTESIPDNLRSELRAFHCVHYSDMKPDEATMLIQKASEYVGVSVSLAPRDKGLVAGMKPWTIVLTITALVIGAMAVAAEIRDKRIREILAKDHVTSALKTEPSKLAIPLQALSPLEPYVAEPGDPIFNMTMNTYKPSAALQKVASLVRTYDAHYTVTVAIAPLNAPDKVADEAK